MSSLQGRTIRPGTPEFGPAFESFIHHELRCHAGYRSGDTLAFWRSTSGFEVDFILGDHTAIEVKATENLAPQETRGLAALAEEGRFARYLCVTLERRARQLGQVTVLPYREFLEGLWSGDYR